MTELSEVQPPSGVVVITAQCFVEVLIIVHVLINIEREVVA